MAKSKKGAKAPRLSTNWETMDPLKSGLRVAERSRGVRHPHLADLNEARKAAEQRARNRAQAVANARFDK